MARGKWALVLGVSLLAVPASADDDYGSGQRAPARREARQSLTPNSSLTDEEVKRAPPSRYDPQDELPPPDAAPPSHPLVPTPEGQGKSAPEGGRAPEIEVQTNAKVRLQLGYDSNVFRADRGRQSDHFFHGYGEADLLLRFPGERELYASITGEGTSYFNENIADEAYGGSFVDYYHPISSVFDVDLQNTFEYSKLNLLDDNGDLLPRAKFNAYDEEARAALIAHVTNELSLELGGGGRYKWFEDTRGLPSLDYWEARASVGGRFKVPWWPDGKLRVRYVFRDRQYRDLPANSNDGTNAPGNPKVELRRHQLFATYSQKAELFGMRFVAQLGYTFTYNSDVFENDRSYRENAGSVRFEWWPLPEWTKLETEVRAGTRSFLARQTLVNSTLRQRYVDISMLLWQKIYDHVGIVGEVSYFIYRSTDIRSSYERFIFQAGIEGSF